MPKIVRTMPCPRCGREQAVSNYFIWLENNRRFAAPEDVQCQCGLALRHHVPLIFLPPWGWDWRPRRDDEIPRVKGKGEPL